MSSANESFFQHVAADLENRLPVAAARCEPTFWGRLFTLQSRWKLAVDRNGLILIRNGMAVPCDPLNASLLPGRFWIRLVLKALDGRTIYLNGISKKETAVLQIAITAAANQSRFKKLKPLFLSAVEQALSFEDFLAQKQKRGWIWLTADEIHRRSAFADAASAAKGLASSDFFPLLRHLAESSPYCEILNKAFLSEKALAHLIDERNRIFWKSLVVSDRAFFNTYEKNPLTDEQRKAVACFAPRSLVIAAAGSGKTSVMAAKRAYAVRKKFFREEEILMLAFNNKAAEELRRRTGAVNPSQAGFVVKQSAAATFHAFSLAVIGDVTGHKPAIASYVENNSQGKQWQTLFDAQLTHLSYRIKYAFFTALFGEDGFDGKTPTDTPSLLTARGEVVKSRAEKLLADWLNLCGFAYEYERPYPVDVSDKTHRQYKPDFYLPQLDAWLELWAVADGEKEPPEFAGYQAAKQWKRELHKKQGTKLLEITAGEIHRDGFGRLLREFTVLGLKPAAVELSPESEHTFSNFLSAVAIFHTQAKNNNFSVTDLRRRIEENPKQFGYREKLFLDLYEPLERAWDAELKKNGWTDFESMMHQAAELIESGRWTNPYRLILVDEFQDTSRVRARLIKALLKTPDARLFAVGDDWQAIYRFAGSDLAVMTNFEKEFGAAEIMHLSTTFRCSQTICDLSSRFVQQNPSQIKQNCCSVHSEVGLPIHLITVNNESEIYQAVNEEAARLSELPSSDGKDTVIAVLGRYRRDAEFLPPIRRKNVTVVFSTIHAAKGLEYDHVIIPRLKSRGHGFPCEVMDNPLLSLSMPNPEAFPHAEERRLFYVALTRAKKSVSIICLKSPASVFFDEMIDKKNGYLDFLTFDDKASALSNQPRCPRCAGALVIRTNRNDGHLFYGCSNYPKCRYTKSSDSGLH